MAILTESKRLKKELSLFSVYAIATGTTLSAGFFLLPGLAAREAGPAVVLSYIIAAAFLVTQGPAGGRSRKRRSQGGFSTAAVDGHE